MKGPPSSIWCILFSFVFDKLPTTHYRLLLHDLKNHFPELVRKLIEFEKRMKKLCPLYNKLIYRITKEAYKIAGEITTDIPGRNILAEVVVMTLAGYGEWYYPNNKRFLEEKNLFEYVDYIIDKLRSFYGDLIEEFIRVRKEGLSLVYEIK